MGNIVQTVPLLREAGLQDAEPVVDVGGCVVGEF